VFSPRLTRVFRIAPFIHTRNHAVTACCFLAAVRKLIRQTGLAKRLSKAEDMEDI
jgi:hypothetical protein